MLHHRFLALSVLLVVLAAPVIGRAADASAARALPPSVLPISDCPSVPAEADPLLLRYLDIRSAGAGRWSADNSELAFATSWTGTYQAWRMPAAGGFPQQVTFFPDPVGAFDFSPVDPDLMLCTVASGGNERSQIYTLQRDGSHLTPVAVDPAVWHNLGGWSRDGRFVAFTMNNRDERFFDVWVADLQTGTQRLVWQVDAIANAGAFSPDGKHLLASISNTNYDSDLYVIDLTTSQATRLNPTQGDAAFDGGTWADDRTVYCISDFEREFGGIARFNIDQPEHVEWVYTPEADVSGLRISYNGQYLAWTENRDAFENAVVARRDSLQRLPVPDVPPGVQGVGRFSWDNRYLVLQSTGPTGPGDLYRYDLAKHTTLRLTTSGTGGLDQSGFVVPQVVRIKSFDGLAISALWYEPTGPKPSGGWPVVVSAHGGPEGQTQPWFDPQTQLNLSHGIAVLAPNPRGSSGFGRTFEHLDDSGKRLDSVHDYVAFRDWLVAEGKADPARIAISGGSYGGYVVLAALTFYPDKFSCGVCQFGIANFISFLENTAPYRRPLREAEYGYLDRDRTMLEQISPLSHIASVTAPLLIMQGANDPRVPLSESTQMYEALKATGRDVELLVFADEGHGFVKRENRAIAWGAEQNFVAKHLNIASAPPATD
jgi:dipeptidyl aminopeptidase/acylaminoacyl peptidase